jgi:hypothetical protein
MNGSVIMVRQAWLSEHVWERILLRIVGLCKRFIENAIIATLYTSYKNE